MSHAANVRPASDPATIDAAARILRDGGLVAFPTETVYGLGADATNAQAVARIFEAKGRPSFNPLIVHLADVAEAESLVHLDARAREVAARFWPGPLTLVLPRRADCPVSLLASAGLDTLALRVPGHPVAHALLQAAGRPIAAPSANASGRISPTTARHVATSLGSRVDMIVDGGACPVGIESTVIDLSAEPPILLRPGGLPREELEAILGPLAEKGDAAGPAGSPGRLASHYAPGCPLRLNATRAEPDEGLLAFGPDVPAGAAVTCNLSPSGDLREAAARLFACLHELDRPELTAIAAMPIPEEGLGAAINDRLRRAAAPRDA
ncbi:L-threonylcarbamoyladenylate synthase [Ferruginivarius sediminum]|uniref:Threonylcarbamoyl-AMP synthase n=1 Tax=Ferruginivarius sediminum TaxID=2661937 RepID=A0A369T8B2_9PROT|nr:L-threonylcarbamoyladenylate synthase [Ferruginivarius sediminum]RDD60694.1 threonylcarbamoyl-AMP synthase [Ferruginivarius sediminum]